MSAKVILICGKICSGKTRYAAALSRERRAMPLSADELMLSVYDPLLGDRHEDISEKIRAYLLRRAAELLELDVPVLLDWGFWTAAGRRETEEYFKSRGFETEWHYVQVSDRVWRKNIAARNSAPGGYTYTVDENLARKCEGLFEPPAPEEIDVWVENEW